MRKTRILVVDDEPGIVKFVGASLRAEGYQPVVAGNGQEALRALEETMPDLVVLDIRMPGMDGFEVCRRVREWSQVPIIMLSASGDVGDKVKCLDLGADDYLTKPFSLEELMARVRAVFRRTRVSAAPPASPAFISGELQVSFAERRVALSGREVALTPTEYRVLQHLVLHQGKVLTHAMLLQEVWGPEYGEEREYVHGVINRLRRKIEPDPSNPVFIHTVPAVGYRFQHSPS